MVPPAQQSFPTLHHASEMMPPNRSRATTPMENMGRIGTPVKGEFVGAVESSDGFYRTIQMSTWLTTVWLSIKQSGLPKEACKSEQDISFLCTVSAYSES